MQDINDNDDDPMPQDNGDNKHGTRWVAEHATMHNNNKFFFFKNVQLALNFVTVAIV